MSAGTLLAWGARQRLPGRRTGISVPVRHRYPPGGVRRPDEWFQLHYSWDPTTGQIAELFVEVDNRRDDAQIALYCDIATTLSIALQYGAPLDTLAGAIGHDEVVVMGKVEDWPQTPIGTVLRALIEEQAKLKASLP